MFNAQQIIAAKRDDVLSSREAYVKMDSRPRSLNSIVMLLRLLANMNSNGSRKFIGLLLLFTVAFSSACNSVATQLSEVPKAAAQSESAQPEAPATVFSEPVTPIDADKFTDDLRRTWQRFTASGQYRLAQVSDMRFSDAAKNSLARNIGSTNPIPFVYIWGDLNYDKRVEDDHLAAIIADTTKTGDNRFSLIIFSPPKARKGSFETHWLYRDHDLSKSIVGRASGSAYVTEYLDDGTPKSCQVRWNKQKKLFLCK